jgi:hypothetical protein
VRTIAGFAGEAARHDAIGTVKLSDFGGEAISPGLGFRVR